MGVWLPIQGTCAQRSNELDLPGAGSQSTDLHSVDDAWVRGCRQTSLVGVEVFTDENGSLLDVMGFHSQEGRLEECLDPMELPLPTVMAWL